METTSTTTSTTPLSTAVKMAIDAGFTLTSTDSADDVMDLTNPDTGATATITWATVNGWNFARRIDFSW